MTAEEGENNLADHRRLYAAKGSRKESIRHNDTERHRIMRHILYIMTVAAIFCTSCKEKEQKKDIIVPPPAVEKTTSPSEMQATRQQRDVEWLGARYKVTIGRSADKSLPKAYDENGKEYYDNTITLRIQREDGSDVMNRSFTKEYFKQYAGNSSMVKSGALLGIVLDRIDDGKLIFATSIGSPEISSDEFIPLIMTVDRYGNIKVSLDTRMDSGSDTEDDEEMMDDEGV